MAVVSAQVITLKDEQGNLRTQGWLTIDFSGAYAAGGQGIDLSAYFRRIEQIETYFLSGGVTRAPISAAAAFHVASGSRVIVTPVLADYGTPVSTRFLIGAPSILSGVGTFEDVLSGLAGSMSGIRFGARVLGF